MKSQILKGKYIEFIRKNPLILKRTQALVRYLNFMYRLKFKILYSQSELFFLKLVVLYRFHVVLVKT